MTAAIGAAIAYVDSRPTWDDTGITVGALVLSASISAAVAGRRPWLWALLVGVWTPLVEITASGQLASLVALGFAGAGALIGYAVARALRMPDQATSPPS